jgi:hypothetical protein
MAADGEEARMIVAAHNADCDAYEARIAALEAKLESLGEPRICLNCGRSDPCELKDDPCTPCLFDPDYATGVRMWKDAKAETRELQAKLDDVRMGIGCARGQRSTQFCADLTAAHAELARVKAESLRVVVDGDAMYWDETIVQPVRLERWEDEG